MRKESERTKAKREAIAACKDRTGHIKPHRVVEMARDPKSPLHGEFNWNVKEAAMERWLDRARELIREVKLQVIHEDQTIAVPFYVSDPSQDESSYIAVAAVAKEEDLAEQVMLDELRRCEVSITRARNVAKILNLLPDLDRLLEGVLEVRRRIRPEEKEAMRPSV